MFSCLLTSFGRAHLIIFGFSNLKPLECSTVDYKYERFFSQRGHVQYKSSNMPYNLASVKEHRK